MFAALQHPSQMVLANGIFIAVYALLLFDRIPKVVVALLGGTAVILLGVLTQEQAFRYIDLNVIFLLVGMMVIVNIIQQTGAFHWLAYQAAKWTNGSGLKLLLMLGLMTAVFSSFLDNVTTVLFMATITCALTQKLKINPVPFLITEVISSNIGGTATLIGDPPNILIASAAHLSFNDFLIHVLPVVIIILAVALATLGLIYRKQLQLSETTQNDIQELSTQGLITDKPLLIKSVIILGLVVLAFILHHVIHQEVGTIALAGAALLLLFENPSDIWNDVEWDTIFFFVGLFILVGAVEKAGTLNFLAEKLLVLTHGDFTQLTLALLWVSGILSAIIDNIPYTATVIPMIKSWGTQFPDIQPLWWALSLGACLGGNGTLIGATANVLVADYAANRCKQPIHFMQFTLIGGLIAFESLVLASLYLWLRYLH